MEGRASAPAAATVVNAIPAGRGGAFAIDIETTARVRLTDDGTVEGTVRSPPGIDPALVERCVELALDEWGVSGRLEDSGSAGGLEDSGSAGDLEDSGSAGGLEDPATLGARVTTESSVPVSAGLKSSSAAANAAVWATVDALGLTGTVEPLAACRVGVAAARDVGVTVTGAFDDAAASMLGGVVVTDNGSDEVLDRGSLSGGSSDEDARESWALVWVPPETVATAGVDPALYRPIAPVAETAIDLALAGRYGAAMTVNGLAVAAVLDRSPAPLLEALPAAAGVSISGTGPSVVALGHRESLAGVRDRWDERPGETRLVRTRETGTRAGLGTQAGSGTLGAGSGSMDAGTGDPSQGSGGDES